MSTFYWPIRVYYEDTDSGGMVYHASHLRFFERARTEWLRDLGLEQDVLRQELGIAFVVHSINVLYRRPARFNALLQVATRVLRRRRASLTFDQRILGDDNELICEATVTVACVDVATGSPKAVPDALTAECIHAT